MTIPDGWVWSIIGEVCEKPQYGWTTSASEEGDVRLLRTTDLTHGPINWGTVPFCKEKPEQIEKYLVRNGDIFISRAGSVGVSALVLDIKEPSVFASYLIRVRPTAKINSKFLSLFLNSPKYWSQIGKLSSGIALANINSPKIQSIKLPLPPMREQERIVEILEDHLSRLDAALADVKQAKLKAVNFRSRFIQELLTRELPESVDVNKSNYTESLGDYFDFQSGFAYKSAEWIESGVPVVKIMNVKNRLVNLEGCSFISPETAKSTIAFAVSKGDLLFNMTGATLGVFGFHESDSELRMNQRVGKFIPKSENASNLKYLAYFLESFETQIAVANLAKGAAQPNISPTDILSIPIHMPNHSEQLRISSYLDAILSHVSQTRLITQQIELQANALRRSLLHAAFTGQLTKEEVNV
jgi:type I restriction enzyme S subunit